MGLDYRELEKLEAGPGEERFIRRIFLSDLPDAVSLDHIKEATHRDATYQKLLTAVKSGQGKEDPDLVPYTSVWEELGTVDDLVCRGDKVVIPNSSVFREFYEYQDMIGGLCTRRAPGSEQHEEEPDSKGLVPEHGQTGDQESGRMQSLPSCHPQYTQGPPQIHGSSSDPVAEGGGRSLGPYSRWQISTSTSGSAHEISRD